MKPSGFLTLLWGEAPPGFIHLWRLQGRRSMYFRAPGFTDLHDGRPDVFCGVSLAHCDHGPSTRIHNDTAAAVAGLWADIDVIGGPEHRDHGAGGKDQADDLAHALLEPTVVVDSGYGLHAWWLFDSPWRFASLQEQQRAALMSAQWHELLRRQANRDDWRFDTSTRDLARLLRLPGTVNAKAGEHVPVVVRSCSGVRYDRHELADVCEAAGDVSLTATSERVDYDLGELRLGAGAGVPKDKLHALLINSVEFAATWNHQRPELNDDTSAYDLALANYAVRADWTDQEVAVLIGAHRGWDRKSFRRDYLAMTIGKARASVETTHVA